MLGDVGVGICAREATLSSFLAAALQLLVGLYWQASQAGCEQ